MKTNPKVSILFFILGGLLMQASAQEAQPIASFATPNIAPVTWREAGLMQGLPPAADKMVTKANMQSYPQIRWTLQNIDRLIPSVMITPGKGESFDLPRETHGELLSKPLLVNGKRVSIADYGTQTSADAFVVLKDGKVVLEWYGNDMNPKRRHYLGSVTKSVMGLLAEILIHQKRLDPNKTVADYIPELSKSPFASATLRQILDMQVNVAAGETSGTPDAESIKAEAVMGWSNGYEPDGIFDFLPEVKFSGPNDRLFHYASVTTDVAGWIMARTTGHSVEELLNTEILEKIGGSAYPVQCLVDAKSVLQADGGLNMTASDLGRIGLLIANKGKYNGHQVLPKGIFDAIYTTGDTMSWENSMAGSINLIGDVKLIKAYKSYFYQINHPDNIVIGMGVYGQMLYANPAKNIAIVKYSSYPANIINEYNAGWFSIMQQIAEEVSR